jgi:hypothetical protein
LVLTWSCGDAQEERFETARAFVVASLPKRRRPGTTVRGFDKALARLPMTVLRAVAAVIRTSLVTVFARRGQVDGFIPLGCDGTRLECPRTAELERHLGQAGKPGCAPMVWLTALVHLRLGVPWAWRWGKGTASERQHLRQLLSVLPAAALVVADAGYVGYDLARTLVEQPVSFLIRVSSQATLYTAQAVRLERFREGEVYYGPGAKQRGSANKPLLRLRLIRVRGRKKGRDVWLLTNVEACRLSAASAAQMYRWRWESEGLFRTYKRTLSKVKLHSRTVRLVHREAEGSLLATQLLLAQGALALRGAGRVQGVTCSPRRVLLAIRAELRRVPVRGGGRFGERLRRAAREQRVRKSAKVKRVWPQRKEHKPPKPPVILKLSDAQKARIAQQEADAA